jgi:hypothetical protein
MLLLDFSIKTLKLFTSFSVRNLLLVFQISVLVIWSCDRRIKYSEILHELKKKLQNASHNLPSLGADWGGETLHIKVSLNSKLDLIRIIYVAV